MIFPKISGNSNSLFDLIDITETYNGLTINNSNQDGVFSAVFTDTADLHTEAYLFFVVKNTVSESDSATNLTLSQIKIVAVNEDGTDGDVAWSTDGATVVHDTNGPIECDYVLTGTSDLFVGIEDGTGSIATGDIATHVNTDSNASFNSITTSDKFVKFKVESGTNGVGEVKIDAAGSSTHVHQMPLYTATQLCSAENGGIPNNSYAAFPVRVAIDTVAAFDTLNFKLIISHDGTVGTGADADSSDIVVPITISAQNLMQCQVFVGSTLKVTGNATASGGTLISRMHAFQTNSAINIGTGMTAVDYGFAEGAAAPSNTSNFGHFDNATLYSEGDAGAQDFLALTRNAFGSSEESVNWKDTSAIGTNKKLTISHVEGDGANVINNLKNPIDLDRLELNQDENIHTISFSQTQEGTGISTIEENKHELGGYTDFTLADATKNIDVTFTAQSNAENINSILNLGFVKYPVMSMSSKTASLLTNSTYSKGKQFGVNTLFEGTNSIDTNTIHHDHADSSNSTIHACTATLSNNSHFFPALISAPIFSNAAFPT